MSSEPRPLSQYLCIAAIHLLLLLCPVGGARAAVITIQVGQHQTFLGNNRIEDSPTDTDTPLIGNYLSVYQEADWFNWPIFASDGTPLVDFQLVYDGRSVATPELSTWAMILTALLPMLLKTQSFVCRSVRQKSTMKET
jgi:hypothetical protein